MDSFFSQADAFATSTGLLSVRLGVVLLMTPLLGVFGLPNRFKTMLVVTLSAALVYGIPSWNAAIPHEIGSWISSFSYELVLGLTLSLGVSVAFASISLAGRLIDTQMGYGIAQIFDPLTHRQMPIITGVFNQFAVLFFFILDFHHVLLRGLAMSVDIFPLGKPWPFSDSALILLKHFGGLFSLGFSLVAPIVFCILLVEFALAVLTRNLPQLHMFTLGVPLKLIVGMFALAIWFSGISGILRKLYNSIFESWKVLFQYG